MTDTATVHEMMIVQAARTLANCRSVLVGIGEPNIAAMLAKAVHAPQLVLLYESGVVDSQPSRLPLSIGDACLVERAGAVTTMFELFAYYLAGGRVDAGFVGCAQIDRAGNMNTTVIGKYASPRARLPGSGGASDIALAVSKLIVMTRHEPRRFPKSVDFVTSSRPNGSRLKEQIVITNLAVLEFRDGELAVTFLQPGAERDDVRQATGWGVRFASDVERLPPPTRDELGALRMLHDDRLRFLDQ